MFEHNQCKIIYVYSHTPCLDHIFITEVIIVQRKQERSQDFHWGWGGGGGRLYMCARTHTHPERETRSPLRPGRVFNNALSCYLSLIFKHSEEEKNGRKKHSRSNFRGGGGLLHPL